VQLQAKEAAVESARAPLVALESEYPAPSVCLVMARSSSSVSSCCFCTVVRCPDALGRAGQDRPDRYHDSDGGSFIME